MYFSTSCRISGLGTIMVELTPMLTCTMTMAMRMIILTAIVITMTTTITMLTLMLTKNHTATVITAITPTISLLT